MSNAYYFDYLKKTDRFPQSLYHRAKHEMVKECFSKHPPGSSVLDAGCGMGHITRPYSKDYQIFGIDEQECAIQFCNKTGQGTFIQASLYNIPLSDNFFDLILLLDAIEHFTHPLDVLKELARVLKPQGTILICTMNYSNPLWFILQHTWHRFFGGTCKPYLKEVHPTPYTEKLFHEHCNQYFNAGSFIKRIMGMELFYIGGKRLDP